MQLKKSITLLSYIQKVLFLTDPKKIARYTETIFLKPCSQVENNS
jgi:hypothetical protein